MSEAFQTRGNHMATVLSRLLLLLLFTFSSVAGAAQMYNFSYQFGSGDTITGSFKGDAAGDLITDLRDIAVSP